MGVGVLAPLCVDTPIKVEELPSDRFLELLVASTARGPHGFGPTWFSVPFLGAS